jgi:hypothetical protein
MFSIGPLEFFPPQALRSFSSLGSKHLYALVARDSATGGSPPVVYIGKSIELCGGGIARSHHAVARWRCFGRSLDNLMVCESAQEYDDAALVAIEARLVAMLKPELNGEPAANDVSPWWSAFFSFSHNTPEGTL